MSHHMHILPQLLPLDYTLKPEKKRRLRKLRGSQLAGTSNVDEAEDIDEVFMVTAPQGPPSEPLEEAENDPGQPIASGFSRTNMNTLLKAQEDRA